MADQPRGTEGIHPENGGVSRRARLISHRGELTERLCSLLTVFTLLEINLGSVPQDRDRIDMAYVSHHLGHSGAISQPTSDRGRAEFVVVDSAGHAGILCNPLDDPDQMLVWLAKRIR